jgi:UDP-glucose 4-epimerase
VRVLITGGAGFIGSNLVRALLAAGHVVAVVDDLSTGRPENLDPRAVSRTLDILDPQFAGVCADFAPDAVVHLAAQSSVTVSLRDPERDRLVNAEGTRRVAAAAREAGAHRVLSASSAAVYGEPAELPLVETSPTAPVNPYGASKLEAESLLASELDGTGVDFASLRFSNVYGPRQDAEGEGGVAAIFLARVRDGLPPSVYGDGMQTRDFIFVGDVVAAVLAALAYEGRLAEKGPAFNISTGTRASVQELVGAVRVAAGYLGPVEHEPAREGDIAHSVLDPSRAEATFGWRANVGLETGMALTWRWFAQQR